MKRLLPWGLILLLASTPVYAANKATNALDDGSATVATTWTVVCDSATATNKCTVASLIALAGIPAYGAANAVMTSNGSAWVRTASSANMLSLLGSADYDTARTNLGLAIGTNVQAYDADLASIAAGITGMVKGAGNGSGYSAGTDGTDYLSPATGMKITVSTDSASGNCTAGLHRWFESDAKIWSYCTAANTWTTEGSVGSDGNFYVDMQNNSTYTPVAGKYRFLFEGGVAKVDQNGTAYTAVIGPTAGQILFAGPTQARTKTVSDAAATIVEIGQTLVTRTEFIPVGWMIDGAAAPAALTTTDLGTRQVKTRSFQADTADQDLEMYWQAPNDIVDGDTGTAGFQVKWRPIFVITSATAPAAGEGVAFALQSCSSGSGDTGDCTVGTASVIADADLDAHVQFDIVYGGWTAMTVTDGAAGEGWFMKLYRDQDNAIDDYVQPVGLIGIELKYQTKPLNDY